jgi:hypothetical protein
MMRRIMVALVLFSSVVARAQSSGAPDGSCSGLIAGTAGLAEFDGRSRFVSLATSVTTMAFGQAECLCDTKDLQLELRLTQALPPGTAGNVEVWVGTHCDEYDVRMRGEQCEKIASPNIADLTTAAASSGGGIYYPIPSRALFSPNHHDCSAEPLPANGIFLFAFTDPTTPFATCRLPLLEGGVAPPQPTGVTTKWENDGSLFVTWSSTATARDAVRFGIVAATLDGGMVPRYRGVQDAYSMCLPDGRLLRRALLGSESYYAPDISPQPEPGDPLFLTNGFYVKTAEFKDHTLLTGVVPASGYRLTVVAFDPFGNATPSEEVEVGASPLPPPPPPTTTDPACAMGGRGSPAGAVMVVVIVLATMLRRRWRE